MDVFGAALAAGGEFFRDAAIDAGYELGVFDAVRTAERSLAELAAVAGARPRRLGALLDVLVALGAVARRGDRWTTVPSPPIRPTVVRAGWGLAAEVIRGDRPLEVEGGPLAVRYHAHLRDAGADAAAELAPILASAGGDARRLLDLGGGSGTYTAAYLAADADATATLVDFDDALALARAQLAPFGSRIEFVNGDARMVELGDGYATVLLANVLHLHGPTTCAELVAAAARAVAPGGAVVIKDLRIDPDRGGPYEGVMFALNMALYTGEGDVYDTAQLRAWLAAAGLVGVEERRLASAPEAIVVLGRRPRGASAALRLAAGRGAVAAMIARELDAAVVATGDAAWTTLGRDGARRGAAIQPTLALPSPLRTMLAHALAEERAGGDDARAAALVQHYTVLMPSARVSQLAGTEEPTASLFHTPLTWSRLPRLSAALDRLFAVLSAAGVAPTAALGTPSAEGFRARTPTIAALYERTHYGAAMPLLYGSPADLAYFQAHGTGDVHATIDRYLTTPVIHELCHLAPDRDALVPLHLDECVAGWLGVHVHPEFAYPAAGQDDAIFAAPWLAQVGQAIARAFGLDAVVRAHAGAVAWEAAVPTSFVDAAARLGWADWCGRRTLHLLSDTLDPQPWIALAVVAGSGRSVAGETLASLAQTPLAALELPADPAFDRAIVEDALRAMCLDNALVDGSFRARTRVPDAPIDVDAAGCRITTARRGTVDRVAPAYWIPPAVAARLLARGLAGYAVRLEHVAAIGEVAAAICAASAGVEGPGFALVARASTAG